MYNPNQTVQELQRNFAKVQSAYWLDPNFAKQLLASPAEMLAANGIPFPESATVNIVINSATTAYLIIPAMPANLSPDQIATLSAAGTFGTAGTVGTAGTICGCAATFGSLGTFGCAGIVEAPLPPTGTK
jgi:hypothetical protein